MSKIIRSIQGGNFQVASYLKLPLTILPHTTLNEKFNIHQDVTLSPSDVVSVKYIGIGNKGHTSSMGVDNIALIDYKLHLPRHTALYGQMPFVLRPLDGDLTSVERQRYRLRRIETHDGVAYAAYYLRVLDLSNTVPQQDLRSVRDGVTYSTPYVPTIEDLNPTPPELSNTGVNVTTGDYIACTAKVEFVMTEDDCTEFLNVCNIIHGNKRYAMISEWALCSGVDRQVNGDFNGVSIGYTDAIGVQVVSFISDFRSVYFENKGITETFDVGTTETLLATTSV